MINLHVHFKDDPSDGGTANLTENLITNEAHLYIFKQVCLDEVKTFIDKATELLKKDLIL